MSASTKPAAHHDVVVLLTVAAASLVFALGGCSADTTEPAPAPSTSTAPESPASAEPTEATKAPIAVNSERPDVPGAYTRQTLDAWAGALKQAPRDLKQILKRYPKIPTSQCVALDVKQPVWSSVSTDPSTGTNYVLFGLLDKKSDSYSCAENETMAVKVDLNTGKALQGAKVFTAIQRRAQMMK